MPGKYILSDADFCATCLAQGYEPSGKYIKGEYEIPSLLNIFSKGSVERMLNLTMDLCSDNVELGMLGKSHEFRRLTESLKSILHRGVDAARDMPPVVLVTGETGTGKDMVAKALYMAGPKKEAPFVNLDFGIMLQNPHLFRSEVYGTRKGAYTDSVNQKGVIEEARGGIVYADEIGAIVGHDVLQYALLGLLEGKPVCAVGDTKPMKVDVRIIASTSTDLKRAVEDGRFRPDLYERLDQFRIHVPPLRERKEDIPLFIDFYLRLFNEKYDRSPPFTIGPLGTEALVEYPWPRNIRQLQNVMRKSVLSGKLEMPEEYNPLDDVLKSILKSTREVTMEDVERVRRALEKTAMTGVLERAAWNCNRAAREIGWDRKTLAARMEKHGIRKPGSDTV